jgi:hypothetical protein
VNSWPWNRNVSGSSSAVDRGQLRAELPEGGHQDPTRGVAPAEGDERGPGGGLFHAELDGDTGVGGALRRPILTSPVWKHWYQTHRSVASSDSHPSMIRTSWPDDRRRCRTTGCGAVPETVVGAAVHGRLDIPEVDLEHLEGDADLPPRGHDLEGVEVFGGLDRVRGDLVGELVARSG